jgi:hypothetical protein
LKGTKHLNACNPWSFNGKTWMLFVHE